jgi:hypothetical protein
MTHQANATAAKKELKEAQDAARHTFLKVKECILLLI